MKAERAPKTALVYAVDLLARRAYGELELRRKLAARGYADEEIEAAVERLLSKRYLDDEALCHDLAETFLRAHKYGYRYIRHKLRERGFSDALVAQSLGYEDEAREFEAAAAVVAKKYGAREAQPEKIYRFLLARGFSEHIAGKAARAPRACDAND